MDKCPIQIITIKNDKSNRKWIALLKDIDYDKKKYRNIVGFNDMVKLDHIFFRKLLLGGHSCNICPLDTIRNPTFKEYMRLSMNARKFGITINLKKYFWQGTL